ncbi:MAG: hypothetical protein R3C12_05370 [Planctomycetaceae bacterium]
MPKREFSATGPLLETLAPQTDPLLSRPFRKIDVRHASQDEWRDEHATACRRDRKGLSITQCHIGHARGCRCNQPAPRMRVQHGLQQYGKGEQPEEAGIPPLNVEQLRQAERSR